MDFSNSWKVFSQFDGQTHLTHFRIFRSFDVFMKFRENVKSLLIYNGVT